MDDTAHCLMLMRYFGDLPEDDVTYMYDKLISEGRRVARSKVAGK